MYQEIGPFDAKARFSELLRGVSAGQRYTISVSGKPVADLVPSQASPWPTRDLPWRRCASCPRFAGWATTKLPSWSARGGS